MRPDPRGRRVRASGSSHAPLRGARSGRESRTPLPRGSRGTRRGRLQWGWTALRIPVPLAGSTARSSRGPGRRPLTPVTRVRIPYALPNPRFVRFAHSARLAAASAILGDDMHLRCMPLTRIPLASSLPTPEELGSLLETLVVHELRAFSATPAATIPSGDAGARISSPALGRRDRALSESSSERSVAGDSRDAASRITVPTGVRLAILGV